MDLSRWGRFLVKMVALVLGILIYLAQRLGNVVVSLIKATGRMGTVPLLLWRGRSTDRATAARSASYEELLRRTFTAPERALLADEPVARFVPSPFREAFDRPQGRPDADAASLAPDLFGRGGIALGAVAIALALLLVAIASGLYAPAGMRAGADRAAVPVPSQTQQQAPPPSPAKAQ